MVWLDIVEYSHFSGLSISTIRRRIKKELITAKLVDGKYKILSEHDYSSEIGKLRQENIDLKMLINLYEKGIMASKVEVPNDI